MDQTWSRRRSRGKAPRILNEQIVGESKLYAPADLFLRNGTGVPAGRVRELTWTWGMKQKWLHLSGIDSMYIKSYCQCSTWHSIVTLEQACTNFAKLWEPPWYSRLQNGDIMQIPCSRPKNIRRYRTKCNQCGNLRPGICSPLF